MNSLSKKEVRAMMRQRKKDHTAQELRNKSAEVMERLLHHPVIMRSHIILMYASLPDEVYTIDTLERLRLAGKRILLPEVTSETDMQLRVYGGPDTLHEGSFHILEPTGELCDDAEPIDVAVIPGMAFDREGHRLGRGKGYYDRFLNHVETYKIGVCFDFQIIDQLTHDLHDVMMDEIIY